MCGDASIDKLAPQQLQHLLDEFVRTERLELHYVSLE
jgi:hypothetical protein